MEALTVLKTSQTFAVIGLSADKNKYSYQIYQCLKRLGKTVYGISNHLTLLDDEKVYPTLLDLPEKIEVAVFVVSPKFGLDYLRQAQQLAIPFLWMQPGTYDEDFLKVLNDGGLTYYLDCILRKAAQLSDDSSN